MEIQGEGNGAVKEWSELLGASGTSQLPGDLMMQIVTRLPVKSILRFKSICRTWYSLFNHPIFIQHHYRIASSFAKMNNLLSFFVHTENKGKDRFFSLFLDRALMDLNPPFEGDLDDVEVLGSINGLVCLSLSINATFFVLWNPATRKHSRIPNPRLLVRRGESSTMGFAYDNITDSYKVVRMLFSDRSNREARVEIYSTGTNTWTKAEIVGLPGYTELYMSGVVVSGGLYWFSSCMGSNFRQLIVSFDASLEAFRIHPVLSDDKPYPIGWFGWSLEAMVEHPVLIYYENKHGLNEICTESVKIWKLNKSDDGAKEDSFHIEKLTLDPLPDLRRIVKICRNGKMIARDLHEKLILCGREEIKYLPRELGWGCPKFYDYTESLVWPF